MTAPTMETLASAIEQFKTKNDERLAMIEKGMQPTQELLTTVDKLNSNISDLEAKLKSLETQAVTEAHLNELEAKYQRTLAGDVGKPSQLADETAMFMALKQGRPESQLVKASDDQVKQYADYKMAFTKALHNGSLRNLPHDVSMALSVGSQPGGGYLVPADTSGEIVKFLYETSPMRQLANVVSTNKAELKGKYDLGEVAGGWVGERETRSETATPSLGEWLIPVFEMDASPLATNQIIEDAEVDVLAWLERGAAEKFSRLENAAFVAGTGVKQPKGLTAYGSNANAPGSTEATYQRIQQVVSGSVSGIADADKLHDLIALLKTGYQPNARFLMNRNTTNVVRKLKDGDGQYLWQLGLQAGQPATLLGYPVIEVPDLPDVDTNSLSLYFGDMRKAYTIVDRRGITMLDDPYTAYPSVQLRFSKRVGGGLINFEALKVMKFAAS